MSKQSADKYRWPKWQYRSTCGCCGYDPQQEAAEWRAYQFFRSHLTPRQKYTLSRWGYIDIQDAWGTRWRMDCRNGWSGNMYQMKQYAWQGICVVPHYDFDDNLPLYDGFLAQLLFLQAHPGKFRQIGLFADQVDYADLDSYYCDSMWSRDWVPPHAA